MQNPMQDRRGFALEASMIILVLLATLIGAAVAGIVMVQRAAGVDYRGSRTTYAAEAGADAVMAQLELAMSDGSISDPDLAALTAPTIPGMTVTVGATRDGAAAPRTITSGPYTGLIGLNQKINVAVQARDQMANQSQVVVSVNAQTIPLFQFGVFYEGDLEIHNGPPLTFAGWVHTNGNLYLTSANQYFKDLVTTAGSVYWQRKAYSERLNGVFINRADSTAVQLDFDSRSDPTPAAFSAKSQSHFDGRLMTSAMGVTPLRLPLPTGMPPIAMVQPRSGGDTPEVRAVKMAWQADYHLTIDLTQLATVCASGMAVLPRPGGRQVPDAAACAAIFSGQPNAFLEGREDVRPDLLNIDVGALHNWIAADSAHRHIEIMYITFVNTNAGITGQDYPAVRLVNGSQLREPFTVATDAPLYVQGNYNNVGWYPAALMGDAITFLSNQWTDAAHAVLASPANTTEMWVYAAIAAGHSATPCDWQNAGCASPPYGGGLENFPRFLEDWGGSSTGRILHYRGSLVSLFESAKANLHVWSWRGYYNPPQRDWQFDLRFRDPTNLPPGTPNAGSVTQIAFRPVY
ncbi:MAG TPA: hypothetical protein VMJ30_01535 [Gemmatimonadales bacterium]|nr:hypothetical protein [Gemmatimonadales bacterium]